MTESDTLTGPARHWTSRFPQFSVMLVGLCLILLSVPIPTTNGLLKVVKDGTWAVGTSILAAVVFTFVYRSHFEASLQRDIEQRIDGILQLNGAALKSELDRHLLAFSNDIAGLFRGYTPIKVFRASAEPNREFNHLFNEKLRSSRRYVYKGDRALFLCHRILRLDERHEIPAGMSVRVMLLDPRSTESLQFRAQQRQRNVGGRRTDIEELVEDFRMDIFTSVLALYQLRQCVKVECTFIRENLRERVELLDDLLAMSMLPSEDHGAYPDVVCYTRESELHKSWSVHLEQAFDAATRQNISFVFGSSTPESKVKEVLRDLGYSDHRGTKHLSDQFQAYRRTRKHD